MPARRRARLVATVAAALVAVGCSGSTHPAAGPAAGCAPPVQERLDSRSTQHLFPGAAEPSYLTDPPTSGPHQLGPAPTGAVATPIPRPRQVAMLESGFVIVQYRGLPPADVSTLGSVAGNLVTVAPAVGALPNRVVATAWTWKVACGSVDPRSLTGIRAFIDAHKGQGFTH